LPHWPHVAQLAKHEPCSRRKKDELSKTFGKKPDKYIRRSAGCQEKHDKREKQLCQPKNRDDFSYIKLSLITNPSSICFLLGI
jgi:hypothetical protein